MYILFNLPKPDFREIFFVKKIVFYSSTNYIRAL